jgi:hypothetical protein
MYDQSLLFLPDTSATIKTVEEKNVEQSYSIDLNGKTYTGYYFQTSKNIDGIWGKTYRSYHDITSKDYQVTIVVEKGKDKPNFFSLVDSNYLSNVQTEALSNEALLEKVISFMSEINDDIDDYTIKTTTENRKDYGTVLKIEFERIVEGIKTNDYASASITEYGDIINYSCTYCFGELNDFDFPDASKIEKIKNRVWKHYSSSDLKHDENNYQMSISLEKLNVFGYVLEICVHDDNDCCQTQYYYVPI